MIHLIHKITLNPPRDLGLVLAIHQATNLGGRHSTSILILLVLDIDNKKTGGVRRKMS